MTKEEKLRQVKDFIRYGGKCFFDDLSDYSLFKEEVEASFVFERYCTWRIEEPMTYPCVIVPHYRYNRDWDQNMAYATYVYPSDFGIESQENT